MDNTIDIDQAEKATKSLLVNNDGYQAKLLRHPNDIRHLYLPMFPATMVSPTNCLLLANVPGTYVNQKNSFV